MIIIKNLTVCVAQKQILWDITLTLEPGSFHVLMGPNGSGKSSLAQTVLGNPFYVIQGGSIEWNGQDITQLPPEERVRRGMFVSFQNPPAIPGVSVFAFLKEMYAATGKEQLSVAAFQQLIERLLQQVGLDASFIARSLNDGFSGGEKKRFEMVQILLLRPELIILDEVDSGLDVDGIGLLSVSIEQLRKELPSAIFLCITHQKKLVQTTAINAVHILQKGLLAVSGGAELLDMVDLHGYTQQAVSTPVFDWSA